MHRANDHAELIDALGGPKKLSDIIRREHRTHITASAVTMWKTRGISWRYRGVVALVADKMGIPVPSHFQTT